ncbi:MAG: hypothetical protein EZS28_021873, partial [Streblomastix strix]
ALLIAQIILIVDFFVNFFIFFNQLYLKENLNVIISCLTINLEQRSRLIRYRSFITVIWTQGSKKYWKRIIWTSLSCLRYKRKAYYCQNLAYQQIQRS